MKIKKFLKDNDNKNKIFFLVAVFAISILFFGMKLHVCDFVDDETYYGYTTPHVLLKDYFEQEHCIHVSNSFIFDYDNNKIEQFDYSVCNFKYVYLWGLTVLVS